MSTHSSEASHEFEYDTTPREAGGKTGCCVCDKESRHPIHRTSNGNNDPLLIKALRELLDHYVGLINSGDAGNWDPEKEGEVAQARAALRLANVAPYMNSPIECGHRLARLVCPDCGIDLRGNVVNSNETRDVVPETLVVWVAADYWRCRCKPPGDINHGNSYQCRDCCTIRPEKAPAQKAEVGDSFPEKRDV